MKQVQHSAVVYRQRCRCIGFPARALFAPFEKRKSIGIEERSAQCRQSHRLMLDPAINSAEYREQTGPRIPATFEDFFRLAAKLHPQGRGSVIGLVALVSQQQESALFSG